MKDEFIRKALVTKVVDGDTLRCQIDLGWGAYLKHDIRLSFVNTPEVRGKEKRAGIYVASKVAALVNEHPNITIRSNEFKTGKFGRCVCEVIVHQNTSDLSLNDWLLDNGYGWLTDDNGSLKEPRDLKRLSGIPYGFAQTPNTLVTSLKNMFTWSKAA